MKIQTITSTKLISNFFECVVDIAMDEPEMQRFNLNYELQIFAEGNIEKMKAAIIEEPFQYAIEEEADLIIVTEQTFSTKDNKLLFTITGSELNF